MAKGKVNISLDVGSQLGSEPMVVSSVNLQAIEDAELDRNLREIKAKQELKKDWFLFILRDVVIFACAIIFILAVGGYSLLTLCWSKHFGVG
jgi:CHASE3 domain sensor protein